MNHVEAAIAERVAQLYPDVFAALAEFADRYADFIEETVTRFDREVQFYLAWLEFTARLRSAGLPVCYPQIHTGAGHLEAVDAFDAALADKLLGQGEQVITNDVTLTGSERVLVVTGPNQGGKTTYARTVGQLHYLASLGLPVPGRRARLPLPDRIFTHFERGENLHDLTGKLEDDLTRIRDILTAATENSLLIINEIFTSTSPQDASLLATRVLHQVIGLGCACVCVTFLDELSTLDPATVSMTSTVIPGSSGTRTFRVVRRAADGRAYADAIADKYGLTTQALARRLTP